MLSRRLTTDQVADLILAACPSFQSIYDASDDQDLPYLVAGDLAEHLLELLRQDEKDELVAVAKVIERLHLEGDSEVRTLATVGYLEGIQNTWSRHTDPEIFGSLLLPESRKSWEDLYRFWNGKRPPS